MRAINALQSFTDFDWEDLGIGEQEYEDYKSKYLDLHDRIKQDAAKQKTSILDDIDFELELIHRDIIDVSYILKLIAKIKTSNPSEAKAQKKSNYGFAGRRYYAA